MSEDEVEPSSEEQLQDQSDEWHAAPIPAELHEALTDRVLALADLLRERAAAHEASERAFNAYTRLDLDDRSYETKSAAHLRVYDAEVAKRDALGDPIRGTLYRVVEAQHAIEGFFIDVDAYREMDPDEGRRRECAAATFTPGAYAVVVTEVTDLDETWDAEYTVAPYLEGRLGYIGRLGYLGDSASSAIKRVRHVSSETVLEGVHLDDAIRVKEELIKLGCKAQVVERAASPSYQREAIPPHVRREVWRRDQGRCVECGSRERLEFDHIIAVSKGGSNTARNIELRCESCNRKKAASI